MVPVAEPTASSNTEINNAKIATLLLISSELLFFAGLISAFWILRMGATDWPPSNQPRLPIAVTAFNTAALLLSAFWLKRLPKDLDGEELFRHFFPVLALGAVFWIGQGIEWVRLIHEGLTLRSSLYGSLFYLVVGAHAVHAVAGWCWLFAAIVRAARSGKKGALEAARLFWFFVSYLWPVLYVSVYF